ncbi:hypothetical protein BV25DRAFT_1412641 [Artomyces pyxidatus]|uniref:Uncharacterized protein n=1 Tax=Artomyces pyxidatus TaxID=48021 RepID=A0ACB8TE14_9AGAM|nr:hypothetical protein BV25DRAFT_1412641 [Artomyces pyxidatus]
MLRDSRVNSVSESLIYSLYPLVVETILLGVFSCLVVLSTYLLLWRPRTTGNLLVLVITITMYIFAVMHWSAYLIGNIYFFTNPRHVFFDPHSALRQILVYLGLTVNLILSDVIVIWRAWHLSNKEPWVLLISSIFFLATIATAVLTGLYSHILSAFPAFSATWSVVTVAVTLGTNLWATALIARKTWLHRQVIRKNLREGSRRTRVELTLTLLVESGSIYCLYLAFVLLSLLQLVGPLNPIFSATIPQVTAIYPTTLVVMLCLRQDDSNPVISLERQTEPRAEDRSRA